MTLAHAQKRPICKEKRPEKETYRKRDLDAKERDLVTLAHA